METALISIFCCLSGIDLFEATKIILLITVIIVVYSGSNDKYKKCVLLPVRNNEVTYFSFILIMIYTVC